ncbi:phosphopantetheine-binding protein [Anaerococcus sp. NML200574]|uniref:Acyl carrier protein n=1 Tax=Anaerococcus kampingae TaxID=3115614 RepID=A0ABW9MFQ3_9FIRM|nr:MULTISPECIES: phosphopantetheine-binding protein [unclassified Anaerococcus]MCW6678127.1 phosphopantetheine-binding protein [Anaerococcus sp. NML200574]MCW6701303.1 phosphopantetheine-binding protein [Anaerococcus sp. NML200537]
MIREQLTKLAEENLDIDVANIDFESKISDLDIDSIDLVDFIMLVEEEFEIEFSEEELDEIESLADIVSLIESKN